MGEVLGFVLGFIKIMWKWILLGVALCVLIAQIWSFLGPVDSLEKADAIVAISGGDTDARASAAIQLYHDGWAPKIIFSGAALDPLSPSNAAVMRERAVRGGVPSDDVVIEESAVDTAQNALKSNKILENLKVKKIILVTAGYHQRRASMEFSQATGGTIKIINHPTDDKDWSHLWWTNVRGWWLAISELLKISVIWLRVHI